MTVAARPPVPTSSGRTPRMDDLPVAVVGAGPVGLAAAAHLVARGLVPAVFEQGPAAGHAASRWGHVRLFSPWRYNTDKTARALLEGQGWTAPDPDALPTGTDLVARYLAPLAAHPALAPHIRYGARVLHIARDGLDRTMTPGRESTPFALVWRDASNAEQRTLARAVIDATGTWGAPNPVGVDGTAVVGEREAGHRIAYGLPDVLGGARDSYAGKQVLVVGGGHSAINVVLDLLRLQEVAPATRITWALRRGGIGRLAGGGLNDQLPARGALGLAATQAIASGRLTLLAPFRAVRIERLAEALAVHGLSGGRPHTVEADRMIVATGFRPDITMLRELRAELDPVLEAPVALAPMIDPNLHSCGTVRPHGARELSHPEPGLYIVGAKSYGRAPTFLMATGYEQVRSVAAAIAGDLEAAARVELDLPETGVCVTDTSPGAGEAACCGGPAPEGEDACYASDAHARARGDAGCGCGEAPLTRMAEASASCCREGAA